MRKSSFRKLTCSRRDREEFEVTKGQSESIRKLKDRQHNDQKKKKTNNDPQCTTQRTKDRATRTKLKTGVSSGAPEGKQFLLHW